jgi:hypothetical protein
MESNMIKILKLTIILVLISIAFGCATTQPGNRITNVDLYHDKNKRTGVHEFSLPPLGIKITKDIGESLYEKVRQFEYDTYSVALDGDTEAKLHDTTFKTNGDRKSYPLYVWNNDKKAFCLGNVLVGFLSYEQRNACLIDTDNDGYFDNAAYGNNDYSYPLQNKVHYIMTQTPPTLTQDSFRYIVLYQGKAGSSIKLSFREFKDDYARPAFTQDIQYELNVRGDTEIGFKGMRMLVHSATNTAITYTVIEDFQ